MAATRGNPQAVGALLDRAEQALARGDAAAAADLLDEAAPGARDGVAAGSRCASLLIRAGRAEAGEEMLRALAEEHPHDQRLRTNHAAALATLMRFGEAMHRYEEVLDAWPDSAAALNNLAGIYRVAGRHEEADELYAAACDVEPDNHRMASNCLLGWHYTRALDPAAMYRAHRRWDGRYARHLASREPHPNAPHGDRRLRVGYLSADLRHHPVGIFVGALLAAHDRAAVEVVCYSAARTRDYLTDILQGLADGWRDIESMDDEAAARQVRADRVDVLVDLAGHTAEHRLLVMARRPAPVQMTYLGYPDSTGMDAIGYRISDAHADPPGAADAFNSETVLRIAGGFLCYTPPSTPLPVQPPPSHAGGGVTFGSFNNSAKISAETLDLWSRVLCAVPGSRLLLKARALGDRVLTRRFERAFATRGVDPRRVEMRGQEKSTGDHLETYHRVDVALDSVPYNGTTTTCEALWMGVPVVCLAGDRHCARVGGSILAACGLEQLLAADADGYVALACALARDRDGLGRLRASLRETLRASPLYDGKRLARGLEKAYRDAWRAWCANPQGAAPPLK